MSGISFVDFASAFIPLTKAQRVLAAIAFDGARPSRFAASDRDFAQRLFGTLDLDDVSESVRRTAVLVVGARSGKTYVFLAARAVHLAITTDLSGLAPGEPGHVIFISPDVRTARVALNYVKGIIDRIGMRAMVVSETKDSLRLMRPDGCGVDVVCLPAARAGRANRGRSVIFAGIDEGAFFRNETDGQITDSAVYAALPPRVIKGGQIVVASTPYLREGLLWQLFEQNFGRPTTALVARAKTSLMRPEMIDLISIERARDPDNCVAEYDAEFLDSGSKKFFDHSAIEQAIEREPVPTSLHGDRVGIGADFAFTRNSSALVVARLDSDAMYRIVETHEQRPSRDKPLKPSVVVGFFASVAKRYGCAWVRADDHYRESVREHLHAHRLRLRRSEKKEEEYMAVRQSLHEGRVRIPERERRLIDQLKDVTSTPLPGGGVRISSPVRGAAHGDIASAAVLALVDCSSRSAKRDPRPRAGAWHSQWADQPEHGRGPSSHVEVERGTGAVFLRPGRGSSGRRRGQFGVGQF